MKTPTQLRNEYGNKVRQQNVQRYINETLIKMPQRDRDLMKVLAGIDDASGGRLDEFYHLLKTIKNQHPVLSNEVK